MPRRDGVVAHSSAIRYMKPDEPAFPTAGLGKGSKPQIINDGDDRMIHDVSIPAALIAGLVSFLSPCVLPLVPPYLIYLTGATIEHVANDETVVVLAARGDDIGRDVRARLFHRVRGARRQRLPDRKPDPRLVGGAFDCRRHRHHRHGPAFSRADADRLVDAGRAGCRFRSRSGLWGAYVMGLAFAFGWTPCIGPILAAILSVAAAEATVTKGAGLLAVYSAGLGIPFLIAAFMVEQFSSLFARMKRHLATVERAMGVLMVITGIGFLTGSVSAVSIWLLDTFPACRISARADFRSDGGY